MTNTAITSLLYGDTYVQIPGRRPQKVQVMGTNNSFWRLFFVEGNRSVRRSSSRVSGGRFRIAGTPYLFDGDRRDGEKHPAGRYGIFRQRGEGCLRRDSSVCRYVGAFIPRCRWSWGFRRARCIGRLADGLYPASPTGWESTR